MHYDDYDQVRNGVEGRFSILTGVGRQVVMASDHREGDV